MPWIGTAPLPSAIGPLSWVNDTGRGIAPELLRGAVDRPAIPVLEDFIREDGARRPNWTTSRKVAAQAIFKISGKRVPYIGVEKDRKIYPDPYAPR